MKLPPVRLKIMALARSGACCKANPIEIQIGWIIDRKKKKMKTLHFCNLPGFWPNDTPSDMNATK